MRNWENEDQRDWMISDEKREYLRKKYPTVGEVEKAKEFYQDDDKKLWGRPMSKCESRLVRAIEELEAERKNEGIKWPELEEQIQKLTNETKKPQPLKLSIIEALTNQALSFVLGVLIQISIFPYFFGIEVSLVQAAPIAILFMVIGGLRALIIRRIFTRIA